MTGCFKCPWITLCYPRRFFCVFAAKSSVLVRFRTTLSAIASLATLRVLCKRVCLGESNAWCQNNDISSSISVTCYIFPGVGGMAPEKNRVCKGVFELVPVLSILEADVSFAFTESFWNTTAGLYGISLVARQAGFIFQEVLLLRFLYQRNKIGFINVVSCKASFSRQKFFAVLL